MPDAMLPYQALPDLAAALAELADRERSGQPNYKLGCCLLFTHRAGLGEALAFYVDEYFTYLDAMTGDDCVVFVVDRPRRPRPGSAAPSWDVSPEEVDRLVVETARHLDIRFDALPCAMFFVPARERSDRIVLRLARYFPRREHGYSNEDVDIGIHAIAEAIRRAAEEPADTRLDRLGSELADAHARAFGTASDGRDDAVEWPAAVSASAGVIGALASAAGLILGGG
jgi:hypothetical protein